MNTQKPIYTEQGRCQDCYKCVRHCPVKAIQVVRDSATVISERCIYCGTCVNVCPSGAKKVRDDLGRAKQLLRRRPRVVASLAPAYAAEFPDLAPAALIRALRTLGFQVEPRPMSEGTPFANVLLVAARPPALQPAGGGR